MDLNDASGTLTGLSGVLNSTTGWMSKVISWMFTFRNMVFMLLVIGILFIAFKLFENEVNKKKYYHGRRGDI